MNAVFIGLLRLLKNHVYLAKVEVAGSSPVCRSSKKPVNKRFPRIRKPLVLFQKSFCKSFYFSCAVLRNPFSSAISIPWYRTSALHR